MISLNKSTRSCNVLSRKICIQKETKDINLKAFNIITNKNEAKEMTDIFHVIVNANSIVQHVIQIKNGIIKHVNVLLLPMSILYMQKDYNWNPSTCICENSKYLKSIADTSVIECDEIITAMGIVSTKKTNAIATNVTSTASVNCHSKNEMAIFCTQFY